MNAEMLPLCFSIVLEGGGGGGGGGEHVLTILFHFC